MSNKTTQASRYFDNNAIVVNHDDIRAVIGFYTNSSGAVCAKAYVGRAQKPTFIYSFNNVAHRQAFIVKWISDQQARLQEKSAYKQLKKEELAQPNPYKVGDILSSSWGYDQTNVNFYEVVGLYGKRGVILRELKCIIEENSFMSGIAKPLAGQYYDEKIMRKNVNQLNTVKICYGEYASKCDPKKGERCSWYA